MTAIIDCDVLPDLIEEWDAIEEHRKLGSIVLDPSQISLFVSDRQRTRLGLSGYELYEELRQKPVLNATAMGYFIAHPDIIPESWAGLSIYILGDDFS